MRKKIIDAVVKVCANASLDEIKHSIKLAMELSGIEWTEKEYSDMFLEIMSRI